MCLLLAFRIHHHRSVHPIIISMLSFWCVFPFLLWLPVPSFRQHPMGSCVFPPMMRCLLDALVLTMTVLRSLKDLCSSSSSVVLADSKKMADVQMAFFWQVECLKRGVTPTFMSRLESS